MATTPSSSRPRGVAEVLAEAIAHQERGRLSEALASLRRVVALEPENAEALTRLGWILGQQGHLDESIAAHRGATRARPAYASAWSNLGVALQAKGERDEALRVLQHAVSLDANLPEPRVNLGLEWQARGLPSQAIAAFRQAVAMQPGLAESWANLGIALQETGESALALAALGRALRVAPGWPTALSNLQMTSQYEPGLALADLRRRAMAAGAALGAPRPVERAARPRNGRIRVGYVSADLYAHPVGWMASRALRAHDRDAFEVHCYADRAQSDFLTEEIRSGVEHWHEVRGLDDAALRELVLSHGIDVLVDLAGHTANNRLAAFAARSAPVQLAWLGYAASTGVAAMDGVLLGEAMAPTGAQEAFTEPVRTLARTHFTYRPPDYAPAVADRAGGREGEVTFASFNNPAKLGPPVLDCWARLLAAVPRSRLILKWRSFADPAVVERMRARFGARGVDPARIEMRGASPHAQMLAEYGDVDVALDPFPFCGGLTTCEALWMGVPVVTLPWLRPMSRQGLAALRAIGLEDLAARTPREYVALAAGLARDGDRRADLRRALRNRMEASELFDGRGLARELESAYASALAQRRAA